MKPQFLHILAWQKYWLMAVSSMVRALLSTSMTWGSPFIVVSWFHEEAEYLEGSVCLSLLNPWVRVRVGRLNELVTGHDQHRPVTAFLCLDEGEPARHLDPIIALGVRDRLAGHAGDKV